MTKCGLNQPTNQSNQLSIIHDGRGEERRGLMAGASKFQAGATPSEEGGYAERWGTVFEITAANGKKKKEAWCRRIPTPIHAPLPAASSSHSYVENRLFYSVIFFFSSYYLYSLNMLCCSSPADSIGRGEGEHAPLPSWPRLSRDRARVGRLCHGSEYWVVPANTGTVLLVGRFRVAYLVEFRLQDPGRIVDDIKKKKSRQDRK